jgi:hypothetical protein
MFPAATCNSICHATSRTAHPRLVRQLDRQRPAGRSTRDQDVIPEVLDAASQTHYRDNAAIMAITVLEAAADERAMPNEGLRTPGRLILRAAGSGLWRAGDVKEVGDLCGQVRPAVLAGACG